MRILEGLLRADVQNYIRQLIYKTHQRNSQVNVACFNERFILIMHIMANILDFILIIFFTLFVKLIILRYIFFEQNYMDIGNRSPPSTQQTGHDFLYEYRQHDMESDMPILTSHRDAYVHSGITDNNLNSENFLNLPHTSSRTTSMPLDDTPPANLIAVGDEDKASSPNPHSEISSPQLRRSPRKHSRNQDTQMVRLFKDFNRFYKCFDDVFK